jgi:hypothetical protein
VSWAYWAWKYYADPTGSAREALVLPDGQLRATARVLSRTYPEAIAGTPRSMSFDPTNGAFDLAYRPDHSVHAPTVIFVPTRLHYPGGYCARATGARIVSGAGSTFLELVNANRGQSVRVTVRSGSC